MWLWIDDLQAARSDEWGDAPAAEMLRQVIEDRTMPFLDADRIGK